MSSYCGLVNRAGAPIDPNDLTAMAASLTRCAPDATGNWSDGGSAAFFHAMRFTTPESLHECQPWRDPISGLVITGDARIDNRDEIGNALGLSADQLRPLSDSELLLAGYVRWSETLLDRLLGDFAFAIWDPRRRSLFCARDHFGVRPFYYTSAGDEFIFATDLKALFVHPRVSKRFNVDRWLAAVCAVDPGPTQTFYAEIHRLAAGTWLRLDERGQKECRYWSLDPEAELPARSSEEYADEFRALFTEAVRCRLRSAYPVGTHLSGGLDSTAVTCVARQVLRETSSGQLPLRTFSNVLPTVEGCDESGYIAAVVAGGDLAPSFVNPDSAGVFYAWDEFLEDEYDLIFVANHYLLEHLGGVERAAGVRVCLDGFDGDTTVGHGYERFADLASVGDWPAFFREARLCTEKIPEVTSERIFFAHGWPVLEKLSKARQWRTYFATCLAACRHSDHSTQRFLTRQLTKTLLPGPVYAWWRRHRMRVSREQKPDERADDFAFYTAPIAAKLQAYSQAHTREPVTGSCSVRALQCQKFSMGLFSHSLEVTNRLHVRYGVDARHPFLDKRLVEFCVALPADQKLRAGHTRYILREGLRDILPEVVRRRWDKSDYSAAYVSGVVRYDVPRLSGLIEELPSAFDRLVKAPALLAYLQSVVQVRKVRHQEFQAFWRALMSVVWLQHAGFDLF